MNFLVIAQDLRVSGTSEGIVSRSFISQLRITYPNSFIKVVYLKHSRTEDDLELLPANEVIIKKINFEIPLIIKWINKVYWRVFSESLIEKYKYNFYRTKIREIDFNNFDHVFIRSSGLEFETILGSKGLPILEKAIINFHDPYPINIDGNLKKSITKSDRCRYKRMRNVIEKSNICISPAKYLSRDIKNTFKVKTPVITLPHQFVEDSFNLSDKEFIYEKKKDVTIAYHGSLQFGRDVEQILDIYVELSENSTLIAKNTEFVLRLRSSEFQRLKRKYDGISNIRILPTVNFSNSAYEQKYLSDINIILENGPEYCSILLGKAAFLASIEKPIFSLSPPSSELRDIIENEKYIATYGKRVEIKKKFENIILSMIRRPCQKVKPFGDYFGLKTFKNALDIILKN